MQNQQWYQSLKKVLRHNLLSLLGLLLQSMYVVFWCRIKYIEESFPRITDFQNTCQIPASIAVIRGTPDSAQSIIIKNLVSFLT